MTDIYPKICLEHKYPGNSRTSIQVNAWNSRFIRNEEEEEKHKRTCSRIDYENNEELPAKIVDPCVAFYDYDAKSYEFIKEWVKEIQKKFANIPPRMIQFFVIDLGSSIVDDIGIFLSEILHKIEDDLKYQIEIAEEAL